MEFKLNTEQGLTIYDFRSFERWRDRINLLIG